MINCILVKDLSRFGRNYIEVGRYLERIFPVMRVRLIAVTDNYDSQSAWKTSDSIMVPMRNLLNDAYCRDISVKIKSQLAVKRKRGDFVGSFATYGYRKDPTNHSKLIVDELAAENVQSMDTVGGAGDVMHLSQNVVETFIDRIEVFNDESVKIRFTFEDVLKNYEAE